MASAATYDRSFVSRAVLHQPLGSDDHHPSIREVELVLQASRPEHNVILDHGSSEVNIRNLAENLIIPLVGRTRPRLLFERVTSVFHVLGVLVAIRAKVMMVTFDPDSQTQFEKDFKNEQTYGQLYEAGQSMFTITPEGAVYVPREAIRRKEASTVETAAGNGARAMSEKAPNENPKEFEPTEEESRARTPRPPSHSGFYGPGGHLLVSPRMDADEVEEGEIGEAEHSWGSSAAAPTTPETASSNTAPAIFINETVEETDSGKGGRELKSRSPVPRRGDGADNLRTPAATRRLVIVRAGLESGRTTSPDGAFSDADILSATSGELADDEGSPFLQARKLTLHQPSRLVAEKTIKTEDGDTKPVTTSPKAKENETETDTVPSNGSVRRRSGGGVTLSTESPFLPDPPPTLIEELLQLVWLRVKPVLGPCLLLLYLCLAWPWYTGGRILYNVLVLLVSWC